MIWLELLVVLLCIFAGARLGGAALGTVAGIGLVVGALTAVLGGIDGLVFTAGIGENSPAIRRVSVRPPRGSA